MPNIGREGRGAGGERIPSNDGSAAAGAVVAFEVDQIDREGHGWSVLVVGRAAVLTDPAERARAECVIPTTWLPAEPAHVVRVRAEVVSGRRLVPVAAPVAAP